MIDLRKRLSELDSLEAPDLRADIERRIRDQVVTVSEAVVPARTRFLRLRGPLTATATAAVILLLVTIATISLRSETSSTAVPAATTYTTVDPAPLSAPDPWENVIEVTFDGQECAVTGPTSVPAGVGQPFVLTNKSGLQVKLEVGRTEGRTTFAELAEMQRAAGGFVYFDEDRMFERLWPEAFSFDREVRPAIDLADNQHLYVFSLTFGTDVPYLVTNTVPVLTQPGSVADGDPATPDGYWFCGQIQVTAIEF